MKANITRIWIVVLCSAYGCTKQQTQVPLIGTWELISATTTEKDTTFSTFDPSRKMIKIINSTHFAFLNHTIRKDTTTAPFSAGGGVYTLVDSIYTEHLDYFTDKAWENHTFQFAVKITGDTLIQQGIEKVDKLGIDRVIVETYKRATK
ncbi:hypothetical protein [Spirosoma areae]